MGNVPTPAAASIPFLGKHPVRPELRPKPPQRRLPPLPPELARVLLHIRQEGVMMITDISIEQALAAPICGEA